MFDWSVYLTILIVFMIYGSSIPPRYHEFLLEDTLLMFSYIPENETSIPLISLLVIAVGFPIIQFVVLAFFQRHSVTRIRFLWDIHSGFLALCGSMAAQLMITTILKNICGLPRPDMISRCRPMIMETEDYVLAKVDVCEAYHEGGAALTILREGFRSFPSGHLSTVFSGMTIASLNIAAKVQAFDKRGSSIKILFVLLPMMVACIVACTRISDNRHFLRDVIAGSSIGVYTGYWFYSQYFPSVFVLENNGRAYPPRRIGVSRFLNNVGGFWKIRDKLPGSFNERVLNSDEVIPLLVNNGFDDASNNDVNIKQTASNINYFNILRGKLKNKYINLNTSGMNV